MRPAETPHVPVIPPPRFFFAVALACGLFFAVWSWLVSRHTFDAFDLACAEFWHVWTPGHPFVWDCMVFMTGMGSVATITMMAVMGAIWQTAIRHRSLAVVWFGVVVGVGFLDMAAKDCFDRSRPPIALRDRAVLELNLSYPSGHSMGGAAAYGMLAYALVLPQRHRPRRVVTVVMMTCMVVLIGFSRIYLRAHWFSDVVGGWSGGVAWVALCVGWFERRRRHRDRSSPRLPESPLVGAARSN